MGNSNTLNTESITKSMGCDAKKIVIDSFTEREIIMLHMLFKDIATNEKNTAAMSKAAFLRFIQLPGIVGMRTFKYFCYKNKNVIDFEEFIVTLAKLKNQNSKEFMSAIFEIFDFDNDGMFGLDDLITLLRTFEKSEIIPQLSNLRIKHIGGSSTEESSKSNDSDEYSNKSIEKLNDSNQLNETLHRKNMFYFDSVV